MSVPSVFHQIAQQIRGHRQLGERQAASANSDLVGSEFCSGFALSSISKNAAHFWSALKVEQYG
ncbi:hypothetical protein ACF1BQ_016685 [Bradyrhizobium sp. RDT10]